MSHRHRPQGRSLAVRLTADMWTSPSCDEDVVVARTGDLPGLMRHPPGDLARLIVVGSPPRDEVGFGLMPLLALRARPDVVELQDLDSGLHVEQSLTRFVAGASVPAAAQIVASAAGLAVQSATALAFRARPSRPRRRSGELRRLVYVRAATAANGAASLTVGGATTHTHEVIRALQQVGVTVDPITNDSRIADAARRDPDPPCTWQVARGGRLLRGTPPSAMLGGDLTVIRAALPAARKADVIYQRHGRFSLVGAILARLTGRPLFLEYNGSELYFHEHWQPGPFARQLAWCERAALATADLIIVVSDVGRRDLLAQGFSDERILVNANGVDATRFARGDGPELRARMGIAEDTILVGFVGSFGPWHGAPALAEAFAHAAEEVPQLALLLVGDGAERGATEAVLAEHGVADLATFAGSVPSTSVPQYLDACDIVVAPHVPLPGGAEFFGSPTKLFEYMASGKAIAASDLGQIGDVLEHEVSALLHTPGDRGELAAGLVRLARDGELRTRLGEAARAEAIARHGWDENARRIVDAYRSRSTPPERT